jgi:hypothetical protein
MDEVEWYQQKTQNAEPKQTWNKARPHKLTGDINIVTCTLWVNRVNKGSVCLQPLLGDHATVEESETIKSKSHYGFSLSIPCMQWPLKEVFLLAIPFPSCDGKYWGLENPFCQISSSPFLLAWTGLHLLSLLPAPVDLSDYLPWKLLI